MPFFFDTSALVKLYHREAGTDIVVPLYKGDSQITISELSKVELLSTIHKKLRIGEITADALEAVRERFLADCAERFVVVPVASLIVDSAVDVLSTQGKRHHLFSLDALQIATFTTVNDNNLTFLCADRRLATLVEAMGYPVQVV